MTKTVNEVVLKYASDLLFQNEVLLAMDSVFDSLLKHDEDPTVERWYGTREQVNDALKSLRFLGIQLQHHWTLDDGSNIAAYGQKYYTESMKFCFLIYITVFKYHNQYCINLEVLNNCNLLFRETFFGNEKVDWKKGNLIY